MRRLKDAIELRGDRRRVRLLWPSARRPATISTGSGDSARKRTFMPIVGAIVTVPRNRLRLVWIRRGGDGGRRTFRDHTDCRGDVNLTPFHRTGDRVRRRIGRPLDLR
jgi:hypothetical protein